MPPNRAVAASELQRLVDVADDLLDAEREQLDARDHRQVQVRERVARERVADGAAQLSQPPAGERRHDVEVRPPEPGGRDHREHGGRPDRRVERMVAGADADRDDRLAERDDHDQREALGEVGRVDAVAGDPGHERPAVVDREREDPQRGLQRAVRERGRDQQQRAGDRARQQPGDREMHLVLLPARDPVEPEMGHPHHQVGEREQQRVVAERLRDGQRHEHHRRHRDEHHQPRPEVLAGDVVGQPRERRPAPPQRGEHEQPLADRGPREVVRHQARHARDREHEHEVEEQLERRDALLGRMGVVGRHRR